MFEVLLATRGEGLKQGGTGTSRSVVVEEVCEASGEGAGISSTMRISEIPRYSILGTINVAVERRSERDNRYRTSLSIS